MPQRNVDYLLFSCTKISFVKKFRNSKNSNFKIHDFFSINLEECRYAADIIQKLKKLSDQQDSIFIVDCLCTLSLLIGIAETYKFVERLNRSKSLVVCIYKRDFDPKKFFRIETLGNVYVKLEKLRNSVFTNSILYKSSITHRKPGGSVIRWQEQIRQNIENFEIKAEPLKNIPEIRSTNKIEEPLKPASSFRLEVNEQEMKQRDSVVLPYTEAADPNKESRIIYEAEDIDDFDEEDPDDDLCI